MNEEEKKTLSQLFNEEWRLALSKETQYYKVNKVYNYFPIITACPEITAEKYRPHIGRSLFSRKPVLKIHKTPKFAYIRKIINYPWRKMGSPQICLKGNKGTGKSVLLNLFLSFLLARGIRAIMFDNSRFESRNIAPHGYFKNGSFIPYQIDIWLPEGYKFQTGEEVVTNPLWKYRNNVKRCEYTHIDDIISSTKPHKLTVIYDECFSSQGRLALFSDLLEYLAERAKINRNYLFVHHELASLVPETPTKEIYKLIQKVSTQVGNLRKDRIGILTSFHLESEIFYRIIRKFSYICHKQPENKRQYTPVEEDALTLAINQVNISRHGFWMKHTIGYFPGLPDMFRLVPQRDKLNYPSLTVEKDNGRNGKVQKEYDIYDMNIASLYNAGHSERDIAGDIGKTKGFVHERIVKLRHAKILS
ncbi:MAG: hypothetical protein ACFFAU_19175 [Candidatus Hodarchaeota archaeon]